jgi:hypothetical protein
MLNYWAALPIAVIGCELGANALTISFQLGAFNTWQLLRHSAEGTVHSVNAGQPTVCGGTGEKCVFGIQHPCLGDWPCRRWRGVPASQRLLCAAPSLTRSHWVLIPPPREAR